MPIIALAKTPVTNKKVSKTVAVQLFTDRPAVKRFIDTMVTRYHCSRANVVKILNNAHYKNTVVEQIKHPYESKAWYVYRNFLITPDRIQKGVNFYKKNADLFRYAQKHYHVPSSVILGILGIETEYGENMGKYHVLDALTTLTFYYPPRTRFFQEQLAQFILYCKENHINPNSVLGSYAGAIGQAQFMPSSIANYGVSHGADKTINMIDQEGDIIDSIANYMHKNGWREHEPIAVYGKVTNFHLLLNQLKKSKKSMTIRAWRKHGIKPFYNINPSLKAKVLVMKLKKGKEFWFVFHNFKMILTYNHSPNYALAVTELGTQVMHAYLHPRKIARG